MITYTVGQELWYEPGHTHTGLGRVVRVQKVGRKWVTLGDHWFPDRYRVKVDEVAVDGGDYSSPGRLWNSKQECREYRELEREWKALRNALTRDMPESLTLESLNEAKRLLGL